MYKKFFGLKLRPFVLSPNPDFLYLSKVHDLALTHLEYGILHDVGFIVLTGDIGAGKTTLLKYLLEKKKIKNPLDIAIILNTNLSPYEFLDMLVKEFELECKGREKSELLDALTGHFITQYSKGVRCVIVVDEAQNLPLKTFEELRMLSNIDVADRPIVQIILVGQPELKQRLSHPSLTQLAQRISVYYHLSYLPKQEVKNYIEHRLKVAGYDFKEPLFDEEAIDFMGEVSKGIPRIINTICDASLTYAYADGSKMISKDIVEQVIKDNELFLKIGEDIGEKEKSELTSENSITSPYVDEKIHYMMEELTSKIKSLELRVNSMESLLQSDRGVEALENMLREEIQKNKELEQRVMALSIKCRDLEKELKKKMDSITNKTETKKRRFFGMLK